MIYIMNQIRTQNTRAGSTLADPPAGPKDGVHLRAGATETLSVSIDQETKAALRVLADSDFGCNLSALVTDFAEEARRRKAAGDYLRRRVPPVSP